MATVTKEQIKEIISDIQKKAKCEQDCMAIVFDHVKLSDIVPSSLVPAMQKIFTHCYDKNGVGYNGIMYEMMERTTLYADMKGFVKVEDFKLHSLKSKDMRDSDNGITYELKSGCGNWLYSKNASFSHTIRNYMRRKEFIRWDYTLTIESKRNGKETFHIYIDCPWKILFAFLSEYESGFNTWWKENARSGENGLYIWEMQNVKTSRKKAVYLTTFEQWKKDKGVTY